MTAYTTCVLNFVQIGEGHVSTLVEVIWNDPYTACTCYQLILMAVLNMVYSAIFLHDKQKHHTSSKINIRVFSIFMAALNKSSFLIFYKINLD